MSLHFSIACHHGPGKRFSLVALGLVLMLHLCRICPFITISMVRAEVGCSVDLLLHHAGQVPAAHKAVQGMPINDVWRYAQEIAMAAARSRPAEDANQQSVLKHYAKVLIAVHDLKESLGRADPQLYMKWRPMERAETKLGLARPQVHQPQVASSLTLVTKVERKKMEVKDGLCHPGDYVDQQASVTTSKNSKVAVVDALDVVPYVSVSWSTWAWRYLFWTLSSFWITFPIFAQIVIACCSVGSVYLLARLRILAKLVLSLLDLMWYYLWSSGGDLMSEFDGFVLQKLGAPATRLSTSSHPSSLSRDDTVRRVIEALHRNGEVDALAAGFHLGKDPSETVLRAATLGASKALATVDEELMLGLSQHGRFDPGPSAFAGPQTDQSGVGLCIMGMAMIGLVKVGRSAFA